MKKIDVDLKVLAKLESQKDPEGAKFHYKIVKVQDDSQENDSLVQQHNSDQKQADEFVQSTSQNILDIKEVKANES